MTLSTKLTLAALILLAIGYGVKKARDINRRLTFNMDDIGGC